MYLECSIVSIPRDGMLRKTVSGYLRSYLNVPPEPFYLFSETKKGGRVLSSTRVGSRIGLQEQGK